MNLKRRFLFLVYAVLLVGMCYSGLQLLGENKAQVSAQEIDAVALSGTCCTTSADGPGDWLCYAASGGLQDCCDKTKPDCLGVSYCRAPTKDISFDGEPIHR